MNKMWIIDDLYKETMHHSNVSVENTGSGNAMFSETGARVLGLFPSPDLPNTLWIPDDIKDRFKNRDWLLGGERQWIAPQQDYFYTNPDTFDGFYVQPVFDPGKYQQTDKLQYENRFSLINHRSGRTYCGCISRRAFSPIDTDPFDSGLSFSGVSIKDYLSIPDSPPPFCAWSIAMVSTHGERRPGTACIPYIDSSALVNYFNPVPDNRCKKDLTYAQFLIDSKDPYKLALTPDGIDWNNPVKIIYIAPFEQHDQWFCVVKCSSDLPKTHDNCVDVPSFDQTAPKGAIQAYNHGYGSEMLYGEIEIQFPKCKLSDNVMQSSGNHELLSYCGTREQITEFTKSILNLEFAPEVF